MLERYFVRPQTVDHIRALWLGPAIEDYVAWLTERRIASRHVLRCVATLEHFNAFAHDRGVQRWDELPTYLAAFVEQRLRDRAAWCRSAKDRRTVLSQARTPVEQMLRLIVRSVCFTLSPVAIGFTPSPIDHTEPAPGTNGIRPRS